MALQVLLLQFRCALVAAAALLIWETYTKFAESNSELVESDVLVTINVAVASACLAAALGTGGLLAARLWSGEDDLGLFRS